MMLANYLLQQTARYIAKSATLTFSALPHLFCSVMFVLIGINASFFSMPVQAIETSKVDFLNALMLVEGEGDFVQKKHFKFLAVPIRSAGRFMVKHEAVLWQTKSPVFSEILIQPQGIYRRLQPEDSYEQLADNAEFSLLLATIFTGQINPTQWQISEEVSLVLSENINVISDNYCLLLQPKAKQLQQLFQQVELCMPALPQSDKALEKQAIFDVEQRLINLFDQQGNKTQISMQIASRDLTAEQAQQLTVMLNEPNSPVIANNKEENKQAGAHAP